MSSVHVEQHQVHDKIAADMLPAPFSVCPSLVAPCFLPCKGRPGLLRARAPSASCGSVLHLMQQLKQAPLSVTLGVSAAAYWSAGQSPHWGPTMRPAKVSK